MNCEHNLYSKDRCRKRAVNVQGIPIRAKRVGPRGDEDVILGYKPCYLCAIHSEGKSPLITLEEFTKGGGKR